MSKYSKQVRESNHAAILRQKEIIERQFQRSKRLEALLLAAYYALPDGNEHIKKLINEEMP